MPPRFDRDNVALCNGGSGGNQMLMNGNMGGNHLGGGANGPISSVSAALRKPLLEINGSSPCLSSLSLFLFISFKQFKTILTKAIFAYPI